MYACWNMYICIPRYYVYMHSCVLIRIYMYKYTYIRIYNREIHINSMDFLRFCTKMHKNEAWEHQKWENASLQAIKRAKGRQKRANWSQNGAKGCQKGANGSQRDPKGTPKGAKGSPKGAQREPKGAKREPKGSQMVSKMHPKVDQSSISEKGRQKVTKMTPKLNLFGTIFHQKSMYKSMQKTMQKKSWKIMKIGCEK